MNPWIDGSTPPKRKRWYDLCLMELANGSTIRAWWNGSEWEGPRYKGQSVIRWRHVHYDE